MGEGCWAGGEGDVGIAGCVGSIFDISFQTQLAEGAVHGLLARFVEEDRAECGIDGSIDVAFLKGAVELEVEVTGCGLEPRLAVVEGGAEAADVDVVDIDVEGAEVEGGGRLLLVALGEDVEVGGSRGGGVEVGVAVGDVEATDDDGAVGEESLGIDGKRQMAQGSHGVGGSTLNGVDEDDVVHVEPQLGEGFEEGEVDAADAAVAGDVLVGHLADNGGEPCRSEDEPAGNEHHQKDEADKRGKGDAGYLECFLHVSLPYRIYNAWW